MALTELQLQEDKRTLYAGLQTISDEVYRMMERWEAVSAFLATMGTVDLDALAVSTTDTTRGDLVDLRNMLLEMVNYWNNAAVDPVKDPKAIVNKIRHMIVI